MFVRVSGSRAKNYTISNEKLSNSVRIKNSVLICFCVSHGNVDKVHLFENEN